MSSIEDRVQKALDEIRPFLQRDGGDIELVGVEDEVVSVEWKGYCMSCSKQLMTLNGVTAVIQKHAPEIKKVVEVN